MDPVSADRLGFGFPIPPATPGSPDAPGTSGIGTSGTSGGAADDAHINLLALFLNLSAVLAGLTAASLLALGLGALGAAAGFGGGAGSHDADVAAGFAAALFIGVTITLVGFAAACASTAAGLRRRRPWSRPAALILALVMLVIVPFGTALGVYAFWVLLRQRARELLGAETGPLAGR
jgi:hypothetical protein